MKMRAGVLALVGGISMTACGMSEWVHPNKPQGAYTGDYNRCEMAVYQEPKLQGGMKMQVQDAIEKCMIREGWYVREAK
jgi:hypothetical protein